MRSMMMGAAAPTVIISAKAMGRKNMLSSTELFLGEMSWVSPHSTDRSLKLDCRIAADSTPFYRLGRTPLLLLDTRPQISWPYVLLVSVTPISAVLNVWTFFGQNEGVNYGLMQLERF